MFKLLQNSNKSQCCYDLPSISIKNVPTKVDLGNMQENSQKFLRVLRYFTLFTLVTSNVVHIEVTQNIVTVNWGRRIER